MVAPIREPIAMVVPAGVLVWADFRFDSLRGRRNKPGCCPGVSCFGDGGIHSAHPSFLPRAAAGGRRLA